MKVKLCLEIGQKKFLFKDRYAISIYYRGYTNVGQPVQTLILGNRIWVFCLRSLLSNLGKCVAICFYQSVVDQWFESWTLRTFNIYLYVNFVLQQKMHLKCDDHRIFFSLTLTPPPFLPSSSTTLVETTFENCHLRLECIWNKWPFMRRFHDPLRFHLIKKASKRNVLTSCFGLNSSFILDLIWAYLRSSNYGLKIRHNTMYINIPWNQMDNFLK